MPSPTRPIPLDAAAEQAWFDGITVVAAAGNMGTRLRRRLLRPGQRPVRDHGRRRRRPGHRGQLRRRRRQLVAARARPRTASPSPTWWRPARTSSRRSRPTATSPACAPPASSTAPTSRSAAPRWPRPIVAGVAADLIAAHPDWTPEMVKGALVNTATQLPGGADEVNATAANWAGDNQLSSDQGPHPQHADRPRHRQHRLQRRELERRQLEHRHRPAGRQLERRELELRGLLLGAPALTAAAATAVWTRRRPAGAPSAGRRSGASHERDQHHQDHLPHAYRGSLTSLARHGCRAVRSPSGC